MGLENHQSVKGVYDADCAKLLAICESRLIL